MSPRRTSCHFGATLVLVASGVGHVARAEPNDDDTALALRVAAVDSAKVGDFSTCKAKAQASLARAKRAETAGLLGLCEVELQAWRDAAEHLDYAIRFDSNTDHLPRYREGFDKAVVHVGKVRVSAAVDGVEVFADGKSMGTAPSTLFLNPGHYVLEGHKQGYSPARVEVDVAAAAALDRPLALEVQKADKAPGGDRSRRPLWPVAVGYSLTAVAVGVGGGLAAAANAQAAGPSCNALCDASQQRQNRFANASLWTFVSGAALAAGTTGYLIWTVSGPRTTEKQATSWCAPWVGLGGAGANVWGRF